MEGSPAGRPGRQWLPRLRQQVRGENVTSLDGRGDPQSARRGSDEKENDKDNRLVQTSSAPAVPAAESNDQDDEGLFMTPSRRFGRRRRSEPTVQPEHLQAPRHERVKSWEASLPWSSG